MYLEGRVVFEIDSVEPFAVGKGETAYRLRLINCRLHYINSDLGDTLVQNYLLIPQ